MIWTCARIQGRVACALTGLVEVVRRSTHKMPCRCGEGLASPPGPARPFLQRVERAPTIGR